MKKILIGVGIVAGIGILVAAGATVWTFWDFAGALRGKPQRSVAFTQPSAEQPIPVGPAGVASAPVEPHPEKIAAPADTARKEFPQELKDAYAELNRRHHEETKVVHEQFRGRHDLPKEQRRENKRVQRAEMQKLKERQKEEIAALMGQYGYTPEDARTFADHQFEDRLKEARAKVAAAKGEDAPQVTDDESSAEHGD